MTYRVLNSATDEHSLVLIPVIRPFVRFVFLNGRSGLCV
jgi:hypothetical protein